MLIQAFFLSSQEPTTTQHELERLQTPGGKRRPCGQRCTHWDNANGLVGSSLWTQYKTGPGMPCPRPTLGQPTVPGHTVQAPDVMANLFSKHSFLPYDSSSQDVSVRKGLSGSLQ